ncbi:MAG: hypothetical protein L0216_12880 [Planctomycetales bacterium]|nr:hypothetical protein [Planctomycetales bacterium]
MRVLTTTLAAAVLAGMGAPASAGDKQLKGETAPEIKVKSWIGTPPGASLKDLRGKAVLLEFFATW